jgi:uncharacterized protein
MNTTPEEKPNGLSSMPGRSSNSVRVFWLDRAKILQRLKRAARDLHLQYPEIERILLFGSMARREAVPGSDADVLLVLRESDRAFLDRTVYYGLFDVGVGVDVVAYTHQELEDLMAQGNAFVGKAMREGVVLWERLEHDDALQRV